MPTYQGSSQSTAIYLGSTPVTAIYVGTTLAFSSTPTISSLSATSTGADTSPSITITGTNFLAGATVAVGGQAASSVTVNSTTSITCTFPSRSRGEYNVTVSNSGATSNAIAFRYITTPVITGFSPNPVAPGGTLTITGSNFNTSGISFYVSTATGYPYYSPSSVTSTSAVITLTNVSSGSCTITPLNDFDGWGSGATVTVADPVPTFSGISPSSGTNGTSVTITGSNFVAGSTSVTIGGAAAGSVSVSSATSLTCTVPTLTSGGAKSVVVSTSAGSASGSFTYNLPTPILSQFTTAGSWSYTVPAGFSKADVVVLGGGAGGQYSIGGDGGGAGSFAATTYNGPTSLSGTVGAGSAGGSRSAAIVSQGGASTSSGISGAGGIGAASTDRFGLSAGSYTYNGRTYDAGTAGKGGNAGATSSGPGQAGNTGSVWVYVYN